CGDPTDPHSFPTRRSSDLEPGQAVTPTQQAATTTPPAAAATPPGATTTLPAAATTEQALPAPEQAVAVYVQVGAFSSRANAENRSEEHTSELQSLAYLVCR